MTKPRVNNHGDAMRKTLIRTGVLAPDTEFNRRAKLYAQTSELNARAREHQRAKAKRKREP